MLNADLELTNAEIISQRHLDLIIEKYLLKVSYDKNKISYYVYEQIKEEIDKGIFQIIESFKIIFKSVNKQIQTVGQSYNGQREEEEIDT